jgi:hypothetical protein
MRFWLPLLVLWWTPASALAVGQGEATLGGGIGPALAFREQTRAGVEAEARLLRGISDSWAARLGLQTAWYPADGSAPSMHVTAQSLGLTWAADALNLVPFADLGILVADVRGGGTAASWRMGGQLGLGTDYLLTPHFTLSLLARIDYFPLRLAGGHDAPSTQVSLTLHAGRAF